jgi:hypothetical protein
VSRRGDVDLAQAELDPDGTQDAGHATGVHEWESAHGRLPRTHSTHGMRAPTRR